MKIHPAIFMIGMLVVLAAIFIAFFGHMMATNKPSPMSDWELKRSESLKSSEVHGRDIGGPQDNRGHSDY